MAVSDNAKYVKEIIDPIPLFGCGARGTIFLLFCAPGGVVKGPALAAGVPIFVHSDERAII